ncbi:MAG: hypothetical protein EAY75_13960 [Bacteroidetes bacterium]|nr:MAG: hypothetical protein EAY75_13960 [Bacteroidota bacterium]
MAAKRRKGFALLSSLAVCMALNTVAAQAPLPDSTGAPKAISSITDSTKLKDSLRAQKIKKTILRSTFVPGWGQITNKQIWKVPAVAAAIGVPAFLFTYNLRQYRDLKQSYIYRVDTIPANDALIPEQYQPLSANSLRFFRNEVRKNVDYSVLAFLIGWGLNVVDAAVFAHLKDFNVSDQLSMRLTPQINPIGLSQLTLSFSLRPKKTYVSIAK